MVKISQLRTLSLGILFLIFMQSCTKEEEGCTDPLSSNYSSSAEIDDGSCSYYYGGRDFGQMDIGSERDLNNEYNIYIDGDYIGRSTSYFPDGLSCGNAKAVGTILPAGLYTVTAIGNGGTEIREGFVQLDAQECTIVLIEYLQIKNNEYSGGDTGGNNGGNTGGDSGGDTGGDDGGDTTTEGDITFWLNQDLGCGNIHVEVTSYGTETISAYYESNPGCNSSSCANFNNLANGAYQYKATSDGDCVWSGNFVIDSECSTIQLTL